LVTKRVKKARLIEGQRGVEWSGGDGLRLSEIDSLWLASTLAPLFLTRPVDEDSSQGLGGRGEEVSRVFPGWTFAISTSRR
jgi:hypothetical protein